MPIDLKKPFPVPDEHLNEKGNESYKSLFENLQGNILKGHGRDYSANIFIQFTKDADNAALVLQTLNDKLITTAYDQVIETKQYKEMGISGSLFGNMFLTKAGYERLGFSVSELKIFFKDEPEKKLTSFPQKASFLNGMLEGAEDLGDFHESFKNLKSRDLSPLQKAKLDPNEREKLEPLEIAYLDGKIEAMLLLADDDEGFLRRKTRKWVNKLEEDFSVQVVAVEFGKALRNQDGEGIEHFGYVDGRSQPLYLESDFKVLMPDSAGKIDTEKSTENINEKTTTKQSGKINIWNPFEPLERVLVKDKTIDNPDAFGSYFVFRKLEQDVMRFTMKEQLLADELNLEGSDRERAGAMVVGRFRDGTPLALSGTDGFIPSKDNNFRYDGLDATLDPALDPTKKPDDDRLGLKCPFQAHIRKTNPRQSIDKVDDKSETISIQEFGDREDQPGDRERRITRRGIPYGDRKDNPNEFQVLDDLPTKDVGLLFACFQSSIVKQFSFMQKTWANNTGFRVPLNPSTDFKKLTGIDPIIGQALTVDVIDDINIGKINIGNPPQHWRDEYGGTINQNPNTVGGLLLNESHTTSFNVSNFVKFRGGEFFFAPSIPFLKNPIPTQTEDPENIT